MRKAHPFLMKKSKMESERTGSEMGQVQRFMEFRRNSWEFASQIPRIADPVPSEDSLF
jgi:hypothetical protein